MSRTYGLKVVEGEPIPHEVLDVFIFPFKGIGQKGALSAAS